MEIFDTINNYLINHPVMLEQLEFMFRIKFWVLLALAFYFLLLVPYVQQRKEINKLRACTKKRDCFLA